MRINDWPFDEQTCQLAFGSYTYGKNLLKIRLFKDNRQFSSKELPGLSITFFLCYWPVLLMGEAKDYLYQAPSSINAPC